MISGARRGDTRVPGMNEDAWTMKRCRLSILEIQALCRRPSSHATLPTGKMMLSLSWQRGPIFLDATGDDPEQAIR
jgi:hypothetical protein